MKSKIKKRLIAFMLCMVLVLSSAISAFADDLDTQAQDQTTTMADEPVATSMDDSTDEQQPVAEAEENQEQAVETQEEQQTEENVEVYHVDESNQTANDISGTAAEDTVTMTTNHFSTYVITTTTDGGVDITVQHYLQNATAPLYRDSTVHLNKGQKIEDLSSPSNYTAQKVVKVNADDSAGAELSGDEVITDNQTYRVYYTATTGTSDESVQMFDYQVKGNNNASINNSSNYDENSSSATRFASGLIKDQYNDNKYDTKVKINESDDVGVKRVCKNYLISYIVP